MAENVFNEDVEFLIRVRDAVAEKDRLTEKASELKGVLKKQEKELASEEKSVQDEIASTTKKRRGEVEEGFDKQISVIKSKKKKAESEKEKTIDAGRESRIREEAREHVEDSKEAEKELKKLFRKNKVPRFARTKLFYVMFMPDGPLEFAMMLVSYLVLLAGIPALITWLVRILLLKDASEKTKTILTILIPSVLIVIFLLIIFMIYVKVKARHRETLRLGRKYRNMVSRNDRKIREIKRDIENDTDESLYDLEAVNQKLDEISEEEEAIREKKSEALKAFDEETAVNIKNEIEARRMPRVEELRGQRDTVSAELESVERALQEKSLEISENYVSHLGEDLLRPDKLEDMIHIMRSGEAATVSGAIACYREIGKAPARKE